jgi:hypothetical protein
VGLSIFNEDSERDTPEHWFLTFPRGDVFFVRYPLSLASILGSGRGIRYLRILFIRSVCEILWSRFVLGADAATHQRPNVV